VNMGRLYVINFGDAFNGGMIDGTYVHHFVHQQHELLYETCKFGSTDYLKIYGYLNYLHHRKCGLSPASCSQSA
jgi:hypothetical protein